MKNYFILSLSFFSICLSGQISFDIDNNHVSFTDNFTNGEFSHWIPLQIQFFEDDLSRESTFASNLLQFVNTATNATTFLENGALKIQEVGGNPFPEDKMSLTKDELRFINGASWNVLRAMVDGGGAGKFNIYNSSGANRMEMGVFSDRGTLRVYGNDGSLNAGISAFNGSNRGYIFVSPTAFTAAAGMYIDGSDQGILFADIKNFRMAHPSEEDTEIWYASIEGPEVAAYDRGTAQLKNGEAFVSFKDHFIVVASTDQMTVTVTPLEWDTYGLAVVEKTREGFRVKELKGGSGNFEFDWEVKCVRTGKQDYEVVRQRDPGLDPVPGRN